MIAVVTAVAGLMIGAGLAVGCLYLLLGVLERRTGRAA